MDSKWNTTWNVIGDFNTIQYPSERFGCEAFSSAMFAFSDFIEANSLWTYLLKALHLLGLEIRGHIVCQELIEPWHRWIG